MSSNIKAPLTEALAYVEQALAVAPTDEAAWLLGEALKRIQDALDES